MSYIYREPLVVLEHLHFTGAGVAYSLDLYEFEIQGMISRFADTPCLFCIALYRFKRKISSSI